jgi:DNA polymerase III sliding clamp (beta) subunit (PCNA family)
MARTLDLVLVECVLTNVENEGTATVPAAKLAEIAKRLPTDDEVKFELREHPGWSRRCASAEPRS